MSSLSLVIAQAPGGSVEVVGVPGGATTTAPGGTAGAPAPGVGTTGTAPTGPSGPPAQSQGLGMFMIPLVVLMVVMIGMSALTGRKDKKKRAELLQAIGRNDRVQTIGGIIGTIVEMADDEVVLRVDEASNTRIRFSKAAVQQVLRKAGGGGGGGGGGPTAGAQAESKPALAKAGA